MSHSYPLSAAIESLESRTMLAQTPFLGAAFAVGAGTTIIQAEDFDKGGEGVAYHDVEAKNLGGQYRTGEGVDIGTTTDVGGGFYVSNVKAGEWLEYTLDVEREGGYNFISRVATIGEGGRFHIEINGVNVATMPVFNSNGWQKWIEAFAFVNLPAGKSIMRISADANATQGSVANFNYFKIFHVPAGLPPAGQGPYLEAPFLIDPGKTTEIPVELFDNGGEGVAYHDVDTANLGKEFRTAGVDIQTSTDVDKSFNLGWAKAGEWTEYTINVPQAGVYTMDFRVASPASNGKFHLEIDGVDATGPLTVPNTGGFQNWTTITKSNVNLASGKHVLRLAMDANGTNGSVGNFNWIKLTLATIDQGDTTLTNSVSTHVQDGTAIDTNFGAGEQLIVKNSTLGFNRQAYLLFDLSFLKTVSHAKLRLWGHLTDSALPSATVGVFSYTDITWHEEELTWNNKLATGPQIGSVTITGTTPRWYEIDVTNYIKAALDPFKIASIVLKSQTFSAGPQIVFNSDDAAHNWPELIVTA